MNAYDNYLAIYNNTGFRPPHRTSMASRPNLQTRTRLLAPSGLFLGLIARRWAEVARIRRLSIASGTATHRARFRTLGYINIGSLGVSPIPLQIVGSDQSVSTPSIKIVDSEP
jgi:hypothetical protein